MSCEVGHPTTTPARSHLCAADTVKDQVEMADYGHLRETPEEDNSESSSVRNRFEIALRIQQQNEAERIIKLRSRRLASSSSPETHAGSVKGTWSDVLKETKKTENEKLDNTRKLTLTPFLMTQGSGLVKDRIDGFEKLFFQTGETIEQVCPRGSPGGYRLASE